MEPDTIEDKDMAAHWFNHLMLIPLIHVVVVFQSHTCTRRSLPCWIMLNFYPVVVATGGELAVAGIPDDAVAESVRGAMPIRGDGVLGLGRRSRGLHAPCGGRRRRDRTLRVRVQGAGWSRNPRRSTLGRRGRGLGAACWRRRRRRRRRRDCTFQVRVQGAGWSRKPRRLALAQRNMALGALGPACRRLRHLRLGLRPLRALGSPGLAGGALVMEASHLGASGRTGDLRVGWGRRFL